MLNLQKKRFLRRMLGYATNPARSKLRVLAGREQHLDVHGVEIVLPPEHDLPFYQRRDPTYDTYAIGLLARLALDAPVTVIDVGANVGDTAAAILASDPRTEVISVEGDQRFVSYVRRNLAAHSDRARLVEGFVGPVGTRVSYTSNGTTGGFNGVAEEGDDGGQEVTEWVTPASLMSMVADDRRLVWKSDIDGFDIHVLVEHWDEVAARCDVIWFEYDPVRTLGAAEDVERLITKICDSGRTTAVYDNLGRLMVLLQPGPDQASALRGLTHWLHEQRDGHITVPYLDLWVTTAAADRLWREAL
ncbi:FkbM family methyltransferase [Dermacoccaceae bacterium W4C1]